MKNLLTFEEFLNESKINLTTEQLSSVKEIGKLTNAFLNKDLKKLLVEFGLDPKNNVRVEYGNTRTSIVNSKGQKIFGISYDGMTGFSNNKMILSCTTDRYENQNQFNSIIPFWYNDFDLDMKRGSKDSKPSANEGLALIPKLQKIWGIATYVDNENMDDYLNKDAVTQYEKFLKNFLKGIESNLEAFQDKGML